MHKGLSFVEAELFVNRVCLPPLKLEKFYQFYITYLTNLRQHGCPTFSQGLTNKH
jgi:hypothetical protein